MNTAKAIFVIAMVLNIASWLCQPAGDELVTKCMAVVILCQIATFLAVSSEGKA